VCLDENTIPAITATAPETAPETPAVSATESAEAVRLENGRKLFSQECNFDLGVVRLNQLPPSDMPEIAFAGRSNVGKSSLINALTNRKSLARTSNTPGRTKEINFFTLGGRMRLVDLPGYGYAKAPKGQVDQWNKLINDYLRGRVNLRRAMVLVDSRHGLKVSDHQVMDMMDAAAVNYQIILTKLDKISQSQQKEVIKKIQSELRQHVAAHPVILGTSSEKGTGIADTRAAIAEMALPE
jgi:GTP-binding protein